MKSLPTTAIVALMTATLGFAAVAPVLAQDAAPPAPAPAANAPANDTAAPPPPGDDQGWNGPRRGGPGMPGGPGMGRPGGMGAMFGLERGSEEVEIALVRLSHRIQLTPEQQPLFEKLKTDAIAAADKFDAQVKTMMPAAPGEAMPAAPGAAAAPAAPDAKAPATPGAAAPAPAAGEPGVAPAMSISQMFKDRIALEEAHLNALKSVEPAFTAFFDSLTPEQQAQLANHHDGGPGEPGKRPGGPGQRPGADNHGGGHGDHGGKPGDKPAEPAKR